MGATAHEPRARPSEVRPIAALGAVGALAWAFIELTDEVLEGDTHAVDRGLLLALREPGDPSDPLGPTWLHEVGRDVTALGGFPVLTVLTIAVLGYLWMRRRRRLGWVLLSGVLGAAAWSQMLKAVLDRPRPELVPHLTQVYSASFPSGHSTASAATYLVLGLMVAGIHRRRAVRAYVVLVAIALTLLVGVSRVYVGVHWPTDVLAGWTLGALWAIAVWTVARWLGRRSSARARVGAEEPSAPSA